MPQTSYIGRKMKTPELQEKPAIVLVTFGSTRRGKAALDLFTTRVEKKYGDHQIFWAYTSEFIRKKNNQPSLQQTLALVESAGYRKAVVVPLHIFPGGEYQGVAEIVSDFPGMRIVLGETLMHRWSFVKEVLAELEKDFLPVAQGLNLLALHGTHMVADPANSAYIGLEKYVGDRYENVVAASLEGVPDHEAVLARIDRLKLIEKYKSIRILPLMYIAGLHVEDDLMGESRSIRSELERMGFRVDCLTIAHEGQQYYKSLAFNPAIIEFYLARLERTLALIQSY